MNKSNEITLDDLFNIKDLANIVFNIKDLTNIALVNRKYKDLAYGMIKYKIDLYKKNQYFMMGDYRISFECSYYNTNFGDAMEINTDTLDKNALYNSFSSEHPFLFKDIQEALKSIKNKQSVSQSEEKILGNFYSLRGSTISISKFPLLKVIYCDLPESKSNIKVDREKVLPYSVTIGYEDRNLFFKYPPKSVRDHLNLDFEKDFQIMNTERENYSCCNLF